MKKCLFLASLVLFFLPLGLRAQNNFDLESDTVCVGQPIHLKPHTMNASSYYWGFCSGYLFSNNPLGDNLGSTFQFSSPSSIEVGKEGDNYYGFVLNEIGSQLLRLDFGKSLSNIPTVTNFGSIDTTVCPSPNSLYLTQDSGKWFLFMCGGGAGAPSTVARMDFGRTLTNVPNGVRFGNVGGLLDDPRGICVMRDGDVYYGFVANNGDDRLIRLNFGKNISRTPTATSLGNPNNYLRNPSDIAPVYDAGKWYLLIPNTQATPPTGGGGGPQYNVNKYFFGNTLSNTPVAVQPTGYRQGLLNAPTSIAVVKDCDRYFAFVTNGVTGSTIDNTIERINIPSMASNAWTGNLVSGSIYNNASGISRILRDKDSVYAFVVNKGDNSLSRMIFPQCNGSSIKSSTAATPPVYHYDSIGTFNIFLVVNDGLPNMEVDCKQIYVENVPPMTISHDTLLCEGDTIQIGVNAQFATGYFWGPRYNISDTQGSKVFVFPAQSTNYTIRVPMRDGCVVDTVIKVDVSHVRADAGPDRTIPDGATTVLGGPNTLVRAGTVYNWFPPEYINDVFSLYPSVNPPSTRTYYMQAINTNGCVDIDTVVVRVTCNGFNLPNAFAPNNQSNLPKTFGMKNRQIVSLYYFRIFDRWGRQVFSTSDPTKEWDGLYNGDPAPFGVYVWEAEGACLNEERIKASGNVTLIR
jgi:gliding motility-associated-like protein